MPKIYRRMVADGSRPRVGTGPRVLGARVPLDVMPDEAGNVRPAGHAMSVAPSLRGLPPHHILKRLRAEIPAARGSNDGAVWTMGQGAFQAGPVSQKLALRPDAGPDPSHGVVEPAGTMPLAEYQQALADTREQWVIDEVVR